MFSIKYLISFVFIHLNTIIFPKLQKTFHNIAIQEGSQLIYLSFGEKDRDITMTERELQKMRKEKESSKRGTSPQTEVERRKHVGLGLNEQCCSRKSRRMETR